MRVRSSAGSAHDESLPLRGGERILGTHGSLVRNLGVGVGGGGQGGRRDRGLRRHELRDRLWHLLRGDRHRLLLRQHLLVRGGDGHRLLRRDGLRLRHRLGHRLCHGQLGQRVDVRHSDDWGGGLEQVERGGMRTRRSEDSPRCRNWFPWRSARAPAPGRRPEGGAWARLYFPRVILPVAWQHCLAATR